LGFLLRTGLGRTSSSREGEYGYGKHYLAMHDGYFREWRNTSAQSPNFALESC
jgi:hypothetical protein